MGNRCLVCGRATGAAEADYHPDCLKGLFGGTTVPVFAYSTDELNRMAKELVLSRMSVPGVQAKLSVHLERGGGSDRMTLVGLDGNYPKFGSRGFQYCRIANEPVTFTVAGFVRSGT